MKVTSDQFCYMSDVNKSTTISKQAQNNSNSLFLYVKHLSPVFSGTPTILCTRGRKTVSCYTYDYPRAPAITLPEANCGIPETGLLRVFCSIVQKQEVISKTCLPMDST